MSRKDSSREENERIEVRKRMSRKDSSWEEDEMI
jgi:hypothetical protein